MYLTRTWTCFSHRSVKLNRSSQTHTIFIYRFFICIIFRRWQFEFRTHIEIVNSPFVSILYLIAYLIMGRSLVLSSRRDLLTFHIYNLLYIQIQHCIAFFLSILCAWKKVAKGKLKRGLSATEPDSCSSTENFSLIRSRFNGNRN